MWKHEILAHNGRETDENSTVYLARSPFCLSSINLSIGETPLPFRRVIHWQRWVDNFHLLFLEVFVFAEKFSLWIIEGFVRGLSHRGSFIKEDLICGNNCVTVFIYRYLFNWTWHPRRTNPSHFNCLFRKRIKMEVSRFMLLSDDCAETATFRRDIPHLKLYL